VEGTVSLQGYLYKVLIILLVPLDAFSALLRAVFILGFECILRAVFQVGIFFGR